MKHNKFLSFAILSVVTVLTIVYATGQDRQPQPVKKGPAPQKSETTFIEDEGEPTGDDPWKELKKLVDVYNDPGGVRYEGTIKLIDDNGTSEKILEEKNFEYSLFNEAYHYSLGPVEMISKKNYIISIDHDNRSIDLSPNSSRHSKPNFFQVGAFKKLMEKQKASARITRSGNLNTLTIEHIQDPTIQGYRIYYSPQTHQIEKLLIGMVRLSPLDDEQSNNAVISGDPDEEDDPAETGYYYYLEINYRDIKKLSLHEHEFVPENKFLSIEKNKIQLLDKYSDYEFNNYIKGDQKNNQ